MIFFIKSIFFKSLSNVNIVSQLFFTEWLARYASIKSIFFSSYKSRAFRTIERFYITALSISAIYISLHNALVFKLINYKIKGKILTYDNRRKPYKKI